LAAPAWRDSGSNREGGTLLSAVYRLNGPELRLRFKPAKKDEVGVFSFAGDDVFPLIGQA